MMHHFFPTLLLTTALHFAVLNRSVITMGSAQPTCERRSMCGYLQINGEFVNAQSLCKCSENHACPLDWDAMDGYTIMHGNDQYKFCEKVRPLPPCSPTETAYASYLEMSFLTQETLLNSGFLYCSCPDHYLLVKNDSRFDQLDNAIATIATRYSCKPPPICPLDNICAAITQNTNDGTTFTTRHCVCPNGFYCPSLVELAKEKVDLAKGSYYIMKCI